MANLNLDCMDVADLDQFSRDTNNAEPVRGYAAIKVRAMRARLGNGYILGIQLHPGHPCRTSFGFTPGTWRYQ